VKRRFAKGAAMLSAVVFIACAVLWGRGFFRTDTLTWNDIDSDLALASGRGEAMLRWAEVIRPETRFTPRPLTWISHHRAQAAGDTFPRLRDLRLLPPPAEERRFAGFVFGRAEVHMLGKAWRGQVGPPSFRVTNVVVPMWAPTLLAAVAPVLWAIALWRHRRARRQGVCVRCGYDLRGSESAACPECGAAREVNA
jgi:hypothetical protein